MVETRVIRSSGNRFEVNELVNNSNNDDNNNSIVMIIIILIIVISK